LSLFVLFGLVFWLRLRASQVKGLKAGMRVKLRGRIASEPILQGNKQQLTIADFRLIVPAYPVYQYGEELVAVGNLETQVINSKIERFSLFYPAIQLVEADNNSWPDLRAKLLGFRRNLEAKLSQLLPEPEASLLIGIVLGVKRQMPAQFYQALKQTGTLHIIVASGYNISVVAGVVLGLLAGLIHRRLAIILSLFVILIYVLLVGNEPAVVRAGIMVSLALLAQFLGRQSDGLRALTVAGGVMLLIKPILLWDLGFQLSFLATLGLILISSKLGWLNWVNFLGIGKDLKETTAAQLMVLPILLINFQQFSWLGFLVNPLILWLVPLIMFLGLAQILLSFIFWPLAKVIASLNFVALHLMVKIINWFGQIGWGQIQWPINDPGEGIKPWFSWQTGLFLVYYGIIFYWTLKSGQKVQLNKNLAQKA